MTIAQAVATHKLEQLSSDKEGLPGAPCHWRVRWSSPPSAVVFGLRFFLPVLLLSRPPTAFPKPYGPPPTASPSDTAPSETRLLKEEAAEREKKDEALTLTQRELPGAPSPSLLPSE